MPEEFNRCVEQGGRVRTVTGPDEDHGLDENEYVKYCFWPGKKSSSVRGEVKKKKTSKSKEESQANLESNSANSTSKRRSIVDLYCTNTKK